jgi:hypothetical protein
MATEKLHEAKTRNFHQSQHPRLCLLYRIEAEAAPFLNAVGFTQGFQLNQKIKFTRNSINIFA